MLVGQAHTLLSVFTISRQSADIAANMVITFNKNKHCTLFILVCYIFGGRKELDILIPFTPKRNLAMQRFLYFCSEISTV